MTETYKKVHLKPQGPGDARPTAQQIVQDEGLTAIPNHLTNKTVLITGGNSGFRLEVAKAVHQAHAKVFIAGRCDAAKGHKIATSIATPDAKTTAPGVRFIQTDLSDLDPVKKGAFAVPI